MSEQTVEVLPPPVPPKPSARMMYSSCAHPLELPPPLPPMDIISHAEDTDRYVSHPAPADSTHLVTASANDPAIALPINAKQVLPRDTALRLAKSSDLELVPSGASMSLREFSKGKGPDDLPCLVKVADGHRSLCEFYSFGQEQMFVVLEKKSMRVVTCRDQVDGSSYAVPLNTTAFELIPYWTDADRIRPNSFGKITANELLQSKALPPVIVVVGEFEISERRSKKIVPVGTLLFLEKTKKGTKDRQGMLHAKSESGETVQITSDCHGRFSILSNDVRVSLQYAVNHLKLPFTMRTISDCDTLYVNVVTVESVQDEEVLVGMMKATAGTTIDNVASFSRMAEVPVNLNLTVLSMVPKEKEKKTLENIYDYAHTGYYGVMRRPTIHIVSHATAVAMPPNPPHKDVSEGHIRTKLGTDMTSLGQPAMTHQPTPVAEQLPSTLPSQPASAASYIREHVYATVHPNVTATVESGCNFPTASKDKEEAAINDGESTCKGEAHTSMDEPLACKVELLETRTSTLEEETRTVTSEVEAPNTTGELQKSKDEANSTLTETAGSPRQEAPISASKVDSESKESAHEEASSLPVSCKNPVPTFRHKDVQNDSKANIAYLKKMQREDILHLLDAMNLSAYKEAFEQEQIDGETMTCLSADMLIELGVSKSLHRLRLMRIVSGQTSARSLLDAHHS